MSGSDLNFFRRPHSYPAVFCYPFDFTFRYKLLASLFQELFGSRCPGL